MTQQEHQPTPPAEPWDQALRLPPQTGSSSLRRATGQGIDFQELRRLVTIRQVLFDVLGWQPTGGRGAQLRGPCPVHGSTTPGSRILSVQLEKNLFRCFKCNASGHQLQLYAAVRRLPFYSACQELCDKLGIEPPRTLAAASPPFRNPSTSQEPSMSTSKQLLAFEIRYGRIVGRAWKNVRQEPSNGHWFSVQIQRIYKVGNQWEFSDSLDARDLLTVARMAERIWTWVHEQAANLDADQPTPE